MQGKHGERDAHNVGEFKEGVCGADGGDAEAQALT